MRIQAAADTVTADPIPGDLRLRPALCERIVHI